MCTNIKKLYEFFQVPPLKDTVCGAHSQKCIKAVKDCDGCGASIKKDRYELTDAQQLCIIKAFLRSLSWRGLGDFSFENSFEENLAQLILSTWNSLEDPVRNKIKEAVTLIK